MSKLQNIYLSSLLFVQSVTQKFFTVDLVGKIVTCCCLHDSHQRIEKEISTFWNPLGGHFLFARCKSIHEHSHIVLTTKYIYVEKLHDMYTSNCLQIWIDMY